MELILSDRPSSACTVTEPSCADRSHGSRASAGRPVRPFGKLRVQNDLGRTPIGLHSVQRLSEQANEIRNYLAKVGGIVENFEEHEEKGACNDQQ
jgi:hypothetical protein